MTTYRIRHVTTYRYKNPVAFGVHRFMLRPRESLDQRTLSHRLVVTPEPVEIAEAEDPAGNLVGHATFGRRARELRFEAESLVAVTELDPARRKIAPHARACPFSYGVEEMPDLARFIERQHADREHAVDAWSRAVLEDDPARESWAFLGRLNAAIRRDFSYLRREEAGIQGPAFTLRQRRGTCRDFATLMAEAARAQGMAARFVSGYLNVPDVSAGSRNAGGFTHAWLQVYLPGAGWIDFDPTSGAVGNRDLIRVATVRDPDQATPLGGSFMGFPSDCRGMEVSVDVRPEPEAGRTDASAAA